MSEDKNYKKVISMRDINAQTKGKNDNIISADECYEMFKKAYCEKKSKPITIIEKLNFRPYKDVPVETILLGEDGYLYNFNDLWQTVSPFNYRSTRRLNIPPDKIDSVIYYSIRYIADRSNPNEIKKEEVISEGYCSMIKNCEIVHFNPIQGLEKMFK